jgi:hypothetical protein
VLRVVIGAPCCCMRLTPTHPPLVRQLPAPARLWRGFAAPARGPRSGGDLSARALEAGRATAGVCSGLQARR